jgi:hypothetical protein
MEKHDPDPYQSEKQDPDLYQKGLDLQNCLGLMQDVPGALSRNP